MADEVTSLHAKPDGSVGNFILPGHPLVMTSADCIGQSTLHNVMLRGKPLEDLASISSMAGFNRPIVVISQEQETDYSANQNEADIPNQNEADIARGVAVNNDYLNSKHSPSMSEGVNRTADVVNVNSQFSAVPSSVPTNSGTPTQGEFPLAFYQQQVMLNHQLFMQQQQTVQALIGKVDGLTKLVENNGKSKMDEHCRDDNTKVKHLKATDRKSHVLSDSDIEDISSQSEFENSDEEDCHSELSRVSKTDKQEDKQDDIVEESDKMKMLQQLEKELEGEEAVSENVNEKVAKIVNLGIRSSIDRKKAKGLYEKYNRPENCGALVVPKINRELWITSALAKTIKDEDKEYQLAQRYLNQGIIPLVQLLDNLLTDKNSENNFTLAKDATQLLAYAHRDMSNLRRQRVKTVVVDKYKPLCNESSSLTENLLGDELEKKIKSLDEMQKVGKGVIKKQWKRKHKNQDNYDRPPKYQKSNNQSQGRYRKDSAHFLEKRSRFHHQKPGQHKRKNQKQ